jgi:hypothetical protein
VGGFAGRCRACSGVNTQRGRAPADLPLSLRHGRRASRGVFDIGRLAHPKEIPKTQFVEAHKHFETIKFREPYQADLVQRFGEKRPDWRITEQFWKSAVRALITNRHGYWGLLASDIPGETLRRARWRRERDSNWRYASPRRSHSADRSSRSRDVSKVTNAREPAWKIRGRCSIELSSTPSHGSLR